MGAYLKAYLDDSNELMRLLFEETAKDKSHDFSYFVEGFMNSKYRELIDKGSTRVINMTYDELIEYLKRDCKKIYREGSFPIDYLQAGWIGKMYNSLQFELNMPSKELYKKIPLKKMMILFSPLHTISDEIALSKIMNELI